MEENSKLGGIKLGWKCSVQWKPTLTCSHLPESEEAAVKQQAEQGKTEKKILKNQ